MNIFRSGLVLLLALVLAGCRLELYGNLSENDANQMLALLLSNKISAEKKIDKANGFSLAVDEDDFVKAIEVLRQNGYPRKDFRSVEELFPSGQLVTSPAQEAEKIKFLQQQSLEKMLTDMEGVINANVVIGRIENQDSRSNTTARQTVSVLIKHTPEVNVKSFAFQIKNLIRNGMPGTRDEDLSLFIQPVNYRVNPNLNSRVEQTAQNTVAPVAPDSTALKEIPASEQRDDSPVPKSAVTPELQDKTGQSKVSSMKEGDRQLPAAVAEKKSKITSNNKSIAKSKNKSNSQTTAN
ncbi:type III secretion system inner membrane ring lipoprotein SctJ [Enterobacter hormaechei]